MKLTKVIRQANDLLKDKCEEKNFQFVCNDNVTTEYEWRDGIHLNNERTRIFVGKFVYYLNDFILSKSIWLLNLETPLKPKGSLRQFSEDSETEPPTNNFDQEISNSSNSKDKDTPSLSELRSKNANNW